MVYRGSEEALGLPVGQMAHLLMQAATDDPTLLNRPSPISAGKLAAEPSTTRRRRQLAPFDNHLPADADPYMEQLVSIAVASARRAEDASVQASRTGSIARRTSMLVAFFGVTGCLVEFASMADHHFNNPWNIGLATIASELHASAEPASGTGGPPSSDIPVSHNTAMPAPDAVAAPPPPVQPVATVMARASTEPPADDGQDATPAPASGPAATPVRTLPAQPYPTQPFGFNPTATAAAATSAQPVTPRTHAWPAPRQSHAVGSPVARRVEAAPDSGPSGNPVVDFQRFMTAMGQGVRSIFR